MHRDVKDISQSPMDIVRDLLRSVQCQSTRWVPISDYGMRLRESVVGTGEQPVGVVTDYSIGGHTLDITEFLEHPLLDV